MQIVETQNSLADRPRTQVPVQDDVFDLVNEFTRSGAATYLVKEEAAGTLEDPRTRTAHETFAQPVLRRSVRFRPSLTPSKVSRLIAEQEFEGLVLSVERDSLIARLHDLTDLQNPEEESEISFDEITDDDRKLITPGALFSWVIGLKEKDRQRFRISEIRFRRSFSWSDEAVNQSKKAAEDLQQLFTE